MSATPVTIASWLLLLLYGAAPAWGAVASVGTRCRSMFQSKQYEQAGQCFINAAKAAQSQTDKRLRKAYQGRYLRNAATAYELAASQHERQTSQRGIDKAAWCREQAAAQWSRYLKQTLFESPAERRAAKLKRAALLKAIGYARLTLDAHHPQARICLTGYRWRHCQHGTSWHHQVRPGSYQLVLRYTAENIIRKQLQVRPRQIQLLHFYPPGQAPPKASASTRWVTIQSRPPGAQVWLNGASLGATPQRRQLAPGRYQLRWHMRCFHTLRRTIALRPGKAGKTTWQGALQPLPTSPRRRASPGRWWGGWIAAAGGVVLVGLGIASEVIASQRHDEAISYRQPPERFWSQQQAYKDAANAGNAWRTAGHIQLGAGGALLATGLIVSLTTPSSKAHCPPPPTARRRKQ